MQFVRRLFTAAITPSTLQPQVDEVWADNEAWRNAERPDKPPSWRSVATWISKYRKAGKDIRALIDRTTDKGNRKPRYDENVIELVDDVIETFYLTQERPTEAATLEEVRGRILKQNQTRPESRHWAVPSLSMLRGRLALLSAFDRYAARHGLVAAKLKYRGAGAGAIAERPLARAAMDHCRINLFVVDEQEGLPLGRPWLTLLLDEATRYVLGYYIGFEEPSNVSVARAIRHAIAPKMSLETEADEPNRGWDAWGLFDVLVVDNGLEFHGETIERGCEMYGIKVQYCPRKRPWYKGKIERFFRTLDQGLIHLIPGKTFSDIFERGDYDPSKTAVVSLTTLRKILRLWVVDYYHQKDHTSLQRSPAQAWEEGIGEVDRYLPPSSTLLDSAFSKSERRVLDKDGIEYDSLFYQSPDLVILRERLGSELEVEVRVMDDDLGLIYVVAPDSGQIIRVPALKQQYASKLTRWQHNVCKRYRKRLYKREGVELELWEVKQRIRALIERDMKLIRRGSRQRQKRMLGDEASSAAATASVTRAPTPAPQAPAAKSPAQATPTGPVATPPPAIPAVGKSSIPTYSAVLED